MTEYRLPFEHEKISFAYIDEQQRCGALLPANPELKDIVGALFMAGAFGEIINQDLLAEAMYEFAPARPKTIFSEQEDVRRSNRGKFRLENILRKTRLTQREAGVFHAAFRYSLGAAIAGRITSAQLAAMSFAEFRRLLLDASADLPETVSIEMRLQLLAARSEPDGLRIASAFVDARLLGVGAASPWREAATMLVLPIHAVDDAFVLDVSGLHAGEDLLVIEAARAPVVLPNGQTGQIFPVALLQALDAATEIKTSDGAFVTGQARGVFSYFAIAGDLAVIIEDFEALKSFGDPVGDGDDQRLVSTLETQLAAAGSDIRIAAYSYLVP